MDRESLLVRRRLQVLLARDLEEAAVRSLEAYQERFPGHEEAVAEEYEAVLGGGEPGALPAGPTAPLLERIGPFRLLRELGRGGQGIVYLAWDERTGRRVALKVLAAHPAPSPEARALFLREAEASARLHFPRVRGVLDAGVTEGVRWIAMEYVPGETLARKIASARERAGQRGCIPLAGTRRGPREAGCWAVVALLVGVAGALHACHVAGVVHGDVKPSNILVARRGRPVLLDLGLSRIEGESPLPGGGGVLGTPAYMPPERLRGKEREGSVAGDVWALAVTLHECLTLRHPFEAPSREAMVQRILRGRPPPASRWNRELPRELDGVLATAMGKDPRGRYGSMEELREAFVRVQGEGRA